MTSPRRLIQRSLASAGSRPWTLTVSSRVNPVSSSMFRAPVDAVLPQAAGRVERGEQVVVGEDQLVHGDDGLVVEVADLLGLPPDGRSVLHDHLAEELARPLGRLPHPGLSHQRGLDRQADGHDVGGEGQRAVDRLPEPLVVLAGELDAEEELDVDLLHRAQILQPRGDVVDGGLDAIALELVVGLGQQGAQVVEEQLPEERLAFDRRLLGLDVLVEATELHVVAGQEGPPFAQLPLDDGDLLRDRLVAKGDLLERPDHGVVPHEREHADGSPPHAAPLELGVDAVEGPAELDQLERHVLARSPGIEERREPRLHELELSAGVALRLQPDAADLVEDRQLLGAARLAHVAHEGLRLLVGEVDLLGRHRLRGDRRGAHRQAHRGMDQLTLRFHLMLLGHHGLLLGDAGAG